MPLPPPPILASDPEVYSPAEDTAFLLENLEPGAGSAADVGTGSGVIALALAASGSTVLATDINPAAVRLAASNARANRLAVDLVRADLLHGVNQRFDLVAFNPPYVREPARGHGLDRAWAGGGTTARFLKGLLPWLTADGRVTVLIEEGDTEAWAAVSSRYLVERRASRRLFFEELVAVTLRPRDDLRDPL